MINIWILIGVSVLAFIISAVWYSPVMFGKTWMKIMGDKKFTKEEMLEAQKKMIPFYVLQFFLSVTTFFVLYSNIRYTGALGAAGIWYSFFMWLGYVMPTAVSAVIWGNTERKYWCKQIAIVIGSQLIVMLIAGYVFGNF